MHDSPEIEGRGTVDRLLNERQRSDMMLSVGNDMIIRLLLVGFNSPSVGARSSSPMSYNFLSLLSTIKCCMCVGVCARIYLPFPFTAHERRTCHTSGQGTVIPIAVDRSAVGVRSTEGRKSHHGWFPSPGDDIKFLPAMPEIDYGHLRDQALAGANTVRMCEFQNSSVAFERGSRGPTVLYGAMSIKFIYHFERARGTHCCQDQRLIMSGK
jgi:hypothetical protein